MTKRLISATVITLSTLFLMSAALNETMLIKAGVSVGSFHLNETTLKQIKSNLGKGKVKKLTWLPPYCGYSKPYYKVSYPKEGISFTFYTQQLNNNSSISTIEVDKNTDAQTLELISAGSSTRADVYNAYGLPTDSNSNEYISYKNLGISFEFANAENLSTDTISAIHIYQPLDN